MLEDLSLVVPQNALAALPIKESTGGSLVFSWLANLADFFCHV